VTGHQCAAALLAGVLLVAACGGDGGSPLSSQGASASATGTGSSNLPAFDPLSIITLSSDTFRSGEEYEVAFVGRDGYEAVVVVPCREAGEVDVAVPPYVSPVSREYGSSPMTAHFNSQEFVFLANDLPELSSEPGEGLAAALEHSLAATRSALNHLEMMAAAGGNDVDLQPTITALSQQIAGQQSVLDELTASGRLVLTDGTSRTELSRDQLAQVDRLLYAQYNGLLQGPVDSAHPPQADQAGSNNPRNPDWDRICEEVMTWWRANGPDRQQLLGASLWTGHPGMYAPIDLQLDEIWYIGPAFASAHTGVGMAWAAMAELTSSRGASDPENCLDLADGIWKMDTAIKLMDLGFVETGMGAPMFGFYDHRNAYLSWKADNEAMLDTMRSWAGQYCPDLSDPGTPIDGGDSTSSTSTSSTSTTVIATTATSDPALPFPRTYTGGGSATWSLSWTGGGCLVTGNTLELTLQEDGTLSGLYGWSEPTFTGVGDPPTSVECGDQIFTFDPIEVTGRHTPPGAGGTGTVVVEIVGWPEWHIEGEYTLSGMTFQWEISLEATGYSGDAPDPRIFRMVDYRLLYVADG
jgi:hypothetical protein